MKYFLLAGLFLAALPAQAATLSVSAPTEAPPSASFEISVVLAASTNPVNVVEGALHIPPGITVDSVSTAGSVFSLWPVYPAYYATDKEVEFSGGVPGGLAKGANGTLFTIRAHADTPGAYAFSFANAAAYINDGKGSADTVDTKGATVTVREGAATTAASTPAAAPLVASIGRDPSLFDGAYFVAFYGGDRGSGVRYEVREGSGAFTPAERYYVLHDQTLKTPVTVRAIDANGVATQVTLNGEPPYLLLALALIVLAALALAWWLRRRKTP